MRVEKQLYQWDTGQKLTECTGIYVDYLIDGDVYRVEITDGACIIPDELLQASGLHKVWECMADNTLREFLFNVAPRPMPPDYVFTPTERLTFEGLVQKVDDAVADMIRRADAGDFNGADGYTPVKGVDYFTEAEIQQIQQEVSEGAIGDFKKVVDDETSKFDANAKDKLDAYNSNADSKVTEYNQNADNRVAEFDAHTEQIQNQIDTKADKTALAITNSYLDALWKLNKGQTYEELEQESEAYSVDVPSGSRYVGIDMVGGKSVVWNQLVNPLCLRATSTKSGLTFTNNGDGSITVSGTATSSGNIRLSAFYDSVHISVIRGHKYYCKLPNAVERVVLSNDNNSISFYNENQILSMSANGAVSYDLYFTSGVTYDYTFKPQIFDLTVRFGADNEPSTVEEFEAEYPLDYYPYCEPTIISSQTDRVDVRGKNLFNPNLLVGEQFELVDGVLKSKKIINNSTSYIVDFPSGSSVSCEFKCPSGMNYRFLFKYEDGTTVQNTALSNGDWVVMPTVTFSKRVVGMSFDYSGASNDVSIRNVQIEKGSTATEYSPYSLQQIETGFPILNKFDSIDTNEGKLITGGAFVDLGTLDYALYSHSELGDYFYSNIKKLGIKRLGVFSATKHNILCASYLTTTRNVNSFSDKCICADGDSEFVTQIQIKDSSYTDAKSFKQAMSGVMLYYELAEEIVTDIAIPTALTDWLTVEAGGSITFHNADDGKRLLIPNKLSFVRKLDEVTV